MEVGKFFAGVGIGMAAGAAVCMVMAPPDRRKLRRTPTGRVLCGVMDELERTH